MKRICLFAGYDSKNIIHDYVVYYLKELSTIADVYYMADNEISDHEKSKISPYVKASYGFNHKKYDFGSWQELINIIGWEKLSEYDELILTNDSVFGPLYPIKELFDKIEKDRQWDICGMIEESSFRKEQTGVKLYNFIQSYFLVIKKKVFNSNKFKDFMQNIKILDNKNDVVFYGEISLSQLFIEEGYTIKKYISGRKDPYKMWKSLIKYDRFPFIKKAKFCDKAYYNQIESVYNYETFLQKYCDYDTSLISNYIKYNGLDKYLNSISYKIKGILNTIKHNRKKIFQINFSRNKKIITLFGIRIYSIDNKREIFSVINKEK